MISCVCLSYNPTEKWSWIASTIGQNQNAVKSNLFLSLHKFIYKYTIGCVEIFFIFFCSEVLCNSYVISDVLYIVCICYTLCIVYVLYILYMLHILDVLNAAPASFNVGLAGDTRAIGG